MKIKRGLCLQTVADGYVVLPLVAAAESFNGMITLNETGVLLWRTLEKGCTKEELVKVLTEPKNCLVNQYRKLLSMDGVDLKFEKDALRELAKDAIRRKTGARGLRAAMERVMTDVMYEAPGGKSGRKIAITAEMVREKLK